MAEQIALDEWMALDEYDISGNIGNFGFERMVALEAFVTFPDPTVTAPVGTIYERNLGGVESAKVAPAGFLDMGVSYLGLKAAFEGSPIITKGEGRALGSDVTMFVGRAGSFNYGGPVGKVVPITGQISSDGRVTPGALYEFGAKTTTADGTSRTTLAVTAGKVRVLHVHVVTLSGTAPTLDVIYETSALGDYTDAITRHTFTQFTGAYLKERAVKTDAVSDLNGRFSWTIGGTGSPSFLVRMSEGVR